jgi:hypothetical protein
MENKNEKSLLDSLLQHIKEYAEVTYSLFKLHLQDKLTDVLSSIALVATLIVIGFLFFSFLSISLALWIGKLLHEPFLGFLILAGFYFLVFLLLYFNGENWIKIPVTNALLKKLNKDEQND